MAITVSGTTVTFNDATTQTTAGLVSGGALGTPSSGTLTNCTSVPVNQATGTLPVANGGTGATSLTANNVLLGNGTSALQVVAPGSNGNILTSNGSTWTSAAPAAGGVTSLNGQTGAITNTTLDTIGSVIAAIPAVSLPGSPDGEYATINCGDTTAGSGLRRNYDSAGLTGAFNSSSAQATGGYTRGGTALSGTWRCMGRSAGYRIQNESTAGQYISGCFVRVS
jgi:hypothetical protein